MSKRITISLASVLVSSVAASVARASETFNGQTYFYGDLHAHTGVSPDACAADGGLEDPEVYEHWESVSAVDPVLDCGTMEDVFDTAVDDGLDFVALTDHHNSDEEDFDYLLGLSLAQDEILVIPSVELRYETTDVAHYGHKNMYVFQDDVTALEGLDLATLVADDNVREDHCQEDIFANVAAVDAAYGPSLLWAHHPSASAVQTTDWSCHDEDWEPVVEIYSGWGNALKYDADFDPADDYDKQTDDWESADATVEEALAMGYRLGFVGGTDRHDTRPGDVCDGGRAASSHPYSGGLTMVVLDEDVDLTRSAIHDELVGRRTLVTSGPQVPVQVTWRLARGAGTRGIGEVIDVPSKGYTTLRVRVPTADEGTVTSVHAVGYGTTSYSLTESSTTPGSWSVEIANATIPSWLYVEVEIDGALYYPEGCDDGGTDDREFVWSSPTWFK